MKQVVCPRFIGWISTYEPSSLKRYDGNGTKGNAEIPVAHISPYSFFMDVARGPRPMVAFAACPRSDEFADSDEEQDALDDDNATNNEKNNMSDSWKDAQRDAEMTGCFCVNFVSQELAWAMNASAAPLGKGLSEFRLMESTASGNCNPTYVRAPNMNAPMVIQSPAVMECKYVKTTKIPDIFDNDSMYSLIIGEVVHIHVRKDCSLESSSINIESQHSNKCLELDLKKARPVARLGYGQEYAVIEEILN
jgi:flavin reductase (DIM6/NTAB) family NADH-FMN oxidoreductase RutF